MNSGSVISSSSNQGQSQGQEASQGPSAMQGQSASSFWGGNSNFNGLESNSWGIGIGTSGSSAASIWGTTNPTSLSVNSQGHNMQSGVSPAGGDTTNLMNSSPRLGWGSALPGTSSQGQGNSDRPQISMQGPQSVGSGNVMPQTIGSGSIMQASLASSAAQITGPPQVSVPVQGQTSSHISVQGSGGVSGFPKSTESAWGSSLMSTGISGGEASNAAKLEENSHAKAGVQTVDSAKSASAAWGNPNSNSNANPHTGPSWGAPTTSTPQQWGNPASAPGQPIQSRWGNGNSGASSAIGLNPPKTQPNTWAQAAGKGLEARADVSTGGQQNVPPTPGVPNEMESELRQAVENHEGWGQRNICQDTEWNIETSPKSQRKFSTESKNNVWNNNNGTAIWEANKASSAWSSSKSVPSNPPGWEGEKDGSSWSGNAPKINPREAQATNWAPVRGEQPPNTNWEKKTETGSWCGQQDESSGISTWGENESKGRWNDGSAKQNIDGTAHWGMPSNQSKPKNWNSTGGPPGGPTPGAVPPPVVKMDEPWKQKPPGWPDQGPPNQRLNEWGGPQQVRNNSMQLHTFIVEYT